MEDLYLVPRTAIEAFEHATKLHVVIHDIGGQLYAYLPPDRFMHRQPICLAMKASHESDCVLFDVNVTRKALQELPNGRIQICHAGLVEWTVPLFLNEKLEWVIFAGQRTPGKGLTSATHQSVPLKLPWSKGLALPPPVDETEGRLIMELLRQLAARLRDWHEDIGKSAAQRSIRPQDGISTANIGTRLAAIRLFIDSRHRHPIRLADLAEYLHISEGRTGHAVRELCGKSFIELLSDMRLETAKGLLEYSNFNVLEVAMRSGFGDLSNFHQAFKKKFKITPHQYRRQRQVGGVTPKVLV